MKFVVVGGGIAGVSCSIEILRLSRNPNTEVILISPSTFVKSVENYRKVGQHGEKFDVKEKEHAELFRDTRFRFLIDVVVSWNSKKQELVLRSHEKIQYDKLCIATGSRPKLQRELSTDPRFVFLRDTESANELKNKLANSGTVLVVGNGGIATELIYELRDVDVTWMVRDKWICASFFPEDVEKFIEARLLAGRPDGHKLDGVQKHLRYSASDSKNQGSKSCTGPALGPDWCANINFEKKNRQSPGRSVTILRNCVIDKCKTDRELIVEYTDMNDRSKRQLKPEIVIWAGGVVANSEEWAAEKELKVEGNGGISVNDACETSVPNVFACGDVCSLLLSEPSPIWAQRQLWTQARQQGEVCGRSMAAGAEEARMQNMYFELFSHCTVFFGMKVVFLGDYKPDRQPIGSWKVVLRNTDNEQLVRCVVVNKTIVGALLIGETDMEETMENLILNKTDLAGIADTFLEPGVDLDEYFD